MFSSKDRMRRVTIRWYRARWSLDLCLPLVASHYRKELASETRFQLHLVARQSLHLDDGGVPEHDAEVEIAVDRTPVAQWVGNDLGMRAHPGAHDVEAS